MSITNLRPILKKGNEVKQKIKGELVKVYVRIIALALAILFVYILFKFVIKK